MRVRGGGGVSRNLEGKRLLEQYAAEKIADRLEHLRVCDDHIALLSEQLRQLNLERDGVRADLVELGIRPEDLT